jgi:hypothetical protein
LPITAAFRFDDDPPLVLVRLVDILDQFEPEDTAVERDCVVVAAHDHADER